MMERKEIVEVTKKKSAAGFWVAVIMLVLFSIAATVGTFLGASDLNIGITAVRCAISFGGIFAMAKLYGTDFRFKGKEVIKGLFTASGLLFLAECVWNFIDAWKTPEIGFGQALPGVVIVLIWGSGVGLYEEALCRGALFNTFRYRMGESRSGIVKSIVFSSLIFGCLHFGNLIDNPHLVVSTFTQVIYATLIGMTLACIYYITDNIWVVSILHGLFDIAAVVMGCFVTSGAQVFGNQDMTILEAIKASGVYAITAVIFFILLFREFKKRGIEE